MGSKWLSICLLAVFLTGCVNDDTVDGPVDPVLRDIATFEGNTSQGACFSFIPSGDAPEVILQGDRQVDESKCEPGQRVLITYRPVNAEAYVSGNVNLLGVNLMTSSEIHFEPLPQWDRDPVYVEALWRSGHYINLRARVISSEKPRIFALYADPSSPLSDTPELYIAHILPEEVDRDAAYTVLTYASFDISRLWSRDDVSAVAVNVANSNLTGMRRFVFDKNIQQ